jgi:hypothetical protein
VISLLGGVALLMASTVAQGVWPDMVPPWIALFGIACAIAGLLYAYSRHCPTCGADSVMRNMGPQRRCEECGTLFLNERFF